MTAPKKQKSITTAEWSDQYKHPKWQKKRLEILEYDSFTCRKCGDKDSTLHVHHSVYIKGRKIWEYSSFELLTLCDKCHKRVHSLKDSTNEFLMREFFNNYRYSNDAVWNYEELNNVIARMAMGGKDSGFGALLKVALEVCEVYEEEVEGLNNECV